VRFDQPGAPDSALAFVTMSPGWHITTGPSAILYDPARTASGSFQVRSTVFLFPGERLEGFGLLVGGRDLEGEGQSYTYFLIRKDGRFLVKRRSGGETRELVPWTEHPAIVRQPAARGDSTTKPVKNVLAVEAGPERVLFLVNGAQVASLPRGEMDVDGIVGLRINHALNLHVTEVVVEPKGP
jgi:hypothetical protein